MRSKFTWILTLFFALVVQAGFAQKSVTGVVKTQDGEPIPGATVMLVGTNQGTDTDSEGKYTLNLKKGDRIQVVYEGFKPTTVTATDSGILNVTLVEDDSWVIDEVIVDTYRTVSKEENATSVSSVTSKTIEGRPNASIIQTLQGQVPGLNIMTGSGQPGASSQVTLRGLGSINGNTEPLYIIDGIPMSSNRFRSLNPNEIDRVDILKDAGATAIYGNRGANGVIVITTKRGSFESDLSIRYIGTTGISSIQRNQYNLMNTADYDDFVRTARQDYPGIGGNLSNAQRSVNTDWTDVFFNDALTQTHTVMFSAGSKNLSTFISVGYSEFGGTLKGTDLKRFSFRTNLDGKNNSEKLTYGTTINANFSRSNMENASGTNGVNQNYFLGAFQSLPYVDPNSYTNGYDLFQDYLAQRIGISNGMPLFLMDKRATSGFGQDEFKLLVNGNINYKLSDKFKISNQTGIDYQTINQNSWTRYDAFNEYLFAVQGQDYRGYVATIDEDRMVFNTNTNVRYEDTFNDVHKVSAGVFLEYLKAHLRSKNMQKTGFDPIFWSDGGMTGWIGGEENYQLYAPTAGMSRFDAGLFSYFGTASYSYDSRYGVDATVRRDASFRFTDDNRWGTFWSVSARWNISNEKFMENSVFNDLKLRGSYGSSGNQDITGGGMFSGAQLYDTRFISAVGYNGETGLSLGQLPNPNLQWEVITQANIGVDFGVWNNRLRGSVDVYQKQTDDLYLNNPLSAINGASSLNANFGTMRNTGVEVNLTGDIIRNENTSLSLRFVGPYNKNEVIEIPNENGEFWNGTSLVGYREGSMVNEFYMPEYLGINPDNGNMMFRSKDGGVTENPNDGDNQWLGKSSMPVYQGGFGIDFAHKGWFLTADFTYALDAWRYDNDYYFFTAPTFIKQNNLSNDMRDYWTPDNRDASFPALTGSNFSYASGSSFYLQDASYLRLRYLTLGYNFNQKDIDFMKLSGLRVYAQAENLYTWTKWRGWDAESSRSIDYGQYPTPRTVSVGVEVQF